MRFCVLKSAYTHFIAVTVRIPDARPSCLPRSIKAASAPMTRIRCQQRQGMSRKMSFPFRFSGVHPHAAMPLLGSEPIVATEKNARSSPLIERVFPVTVNLAADRMSLELLPALTSTGPGSMTKSPETSV